MTLVVLGSLLRHAGAVTAPTVDLIADKWEFGVNPGVSIPGAYNHDFETVSFFTQCNIEHKIKSGVFVGVEAGYAMGHPLEGVWSADVDGDGIGETAEFTSDVNTTIFQLTPTLRLGKTQDWGVAGPRGVRRYLIMGLGLYQTSVEGGTLEFSGEGSSGSLNGLTTPLNSDFRNDFGWNLGFGLVVNVWKHYMLGGDLRYHRIVRNPHDYEYIVPTLRFSRLF